MHARLTDESNQMVAMVIITLPPYPCHSAIRQLFAQRMLQQVRTMAPVASLYDTGTLRNNVVFCKHCEKHE